MKLNPIFNTESNHKEVMPELSIPAKYARNLYRQGFEMAVALRESNKLYGVDVHKIASELGYRGGKFRKWRRNKDGNKN